MMCKHLHQNAFLVELLGGWHQALQTPFWCDSSGTGFLGVYHPLDAETVAIAGYPVQLLPVVRHRNIPVKVFHNLYSASCAGWVGVDHTQVGDFSCHAHLGTVTMVQVVADLAREV